VVARLLFPGAKIVPPLLPPLDRRDASSTPVRGGGIASRTDESRGRAADEGAARAAPCAKPLPNRP